MKRLLFLGLCLAAVYGLQVISENDVSCNSSYLISENTTALVYDGKLILSGRSIYEIPFDPQIKAFSVDLSTYACTEFTNPHYSLPTHADDLTGLKVTSGDIEGMHSYDASTNDILVRGGGTNVFGTQDEFYFAYRKMVGQGSVTGRVISKFCLAGADPLCILGFMGRNTLDSGSKHFSVFAQSTWIRYRYRENDDGETLNYEFMEYNPEDYKDYFMKILKREKQFAFFYATTSDPTTWVERATFEISYFNERFYIGAAASAANSGVNPFTLGRIRDFFIEGYTEDDDFNEFFIPLTVDYTMVPYLYVSGAGNIYNYDTAGSDWEVYQTFSDFKRSIHTVFTYTDEATAQCAWYFVDKGKMLYVMKEQNIYTNPTFHATILEETLPDTALVGIYAVDKAQGRGFIALDDKSLYVINITHYLSDPGLPYSYTVVSNFFFVLDMSLAYADADNELLVHYGPFAIRFSVPFHDPESYGSYGLIFGPNGDQKAVYVDNSWTGKVEGEADSGVFLFNDDESAFEVYFATTGDTSTSSSATSTGLDVALRTSEMVRSADNVGYFTSLGLTVAPQYNFTYQALRVFEFSLYDCSVHTTCTECLTEPLYCGWCVSNHACQVFNTSCPKGDMLYSYNPRQGCPSLVSVSPSAIPQNTNITLNVSGVLYADEANNLKCIFDGWDGEHSPAVDGVYSSLLCYSQLLSQGTHVLQLNDSALLYTEDTSLNVEVFQCNTLTSCGECVAVTGCAWVYNQSVCTELAAIDGVNYTVAVCPSVDYFDPPGGPAAGGQYVTVCGGPFELLLNGTYNTSFVERGGAAQQETTDCIRLNSTCIECLVPTVSSSSEDLVFDVYVLLSAHPANYYVDEPFVFLYYSCADSLTCATCIDAASKPDCKWCLVTSTCYGVGSCPDNMYLQQCPEISTILPGESYYAKQTNLTVTGSSFLDPGVNHEYIASFSGSAVSENFTVYWSSSTSLTIVEAAITQEDVGNMTIVIDEANEVARERGYVFYECSQYQYCSECVDGYDECGWCYGQGCIFKDEICVTDTFNATCPVLQSVSPDNGHMSLETSVLITASYFPAGFNYTLNLKNDVAGLDVNSSLCSYIDENTINCTVPPAGVTNIATILVYINDDFYVLNSTIMFNYFKCSVFTTCSECLELNGTCGFCHFGQCVEYAEIASLCTPETHVKACPVVVTPSPFYVNISGGVDVTLYGDFSLPFNQSGYPMSTQCTVGSKSFLGAVTGNGSAVCYNVPAFTETFPVAPYYANRTIELWVNLFKIADTTFQYYHCGVGELQNDCEACLDRAKTAPVCGYCYSDWGCVESSECSVAGSYINDVCPSLTHSSLSFYTRHSQHELVISGVNLPDFASTGVFCNFSVNATEATVDSKASLRCPTPLDEHQYALKQTVPIYVSLNGRGYTTNSLSFDLLDCSYAYGTVAQGESCRFCSIQDERCGWCSNVTNGTVACVVEDLCEPTLWANYSASCPEVTAVPDIIFYGNGDQLLRFNATKLFPTNEIVCHFTDLQRVKEVETPATVISSVQAVCPTPLWPVSSEIGEVIYFTVLYANRSMFEDFEMTLTIIPDPKDGLNPWLLAGIGVPSGIIVFILFLLIIILIIVFTVLMSIMVYVYRKKGRRRKIVKPNFREVIFKLDMKAKGSPTKQQYRVIRFMEDTILEFESTGFIEKIVRYVKPEETDAFAKNLIYILLSQGPSKVLAVMGTFFRQELAKSDDQATLFRLNSMTTKLFARYARIIGADFLWEALAYFVDEIIFKYSVTKDEEEMSLTSASMEIDPNRLTREEDTSFLAANTYQLLLTLTNLFRRITSLTGKFPRPLSYFLRQVFDEVGEKYPGAEYRSVGGFLFLRWICSAIYAPSTFGLCQENPGAEASRMLVLVAKTMQNISNESLPGQKEKFMAKVDDFITANIPVCHEFINELTRTEEVDPETLDKEMIYEIPKVAYDNALIWFYNFILQKPEFLAEMSDLQLLFGNYPDPIV